MWERLRTGTGQTALLGCLFFFVFMAYFMIQGFSATLYGPKLGADMEATLYLTFTISCFIAPSVVNKLGCRLSMFLGMMGYASLVAASLLYFVLNEGKGSVASPFSWIVILGGAVLGVGAALLWTAQGRLLLEYSSGGTDAGQLWALFWGIFNLSAVAGGLMTATYFAAHDSNTGSVDLYVLFLALILAGATGTFFLMDPKEVSGSTAATQVADAERLTTSSWAEEVLETFRLFGRPRYMALACIYFYTGFNQPYQIVVMGHRVFAPAVLGLQLSLFYAAEIVGGVVAGRMLDAGTQQGSARGGNAKACLTLFAFLMGLGYWLAVRQEIRLASLHETDVGHVSGFAQMAMASAMMLIWGFSDSQIQTYVMWDIGVAHAGDGATQARAVGFYKMVQSAGWSLGFLLSPTWRLSAFWQCGLTSFVGCLGFGLACLTLTEGSKPLDSVRVPAVAKHLDSAKKH